MEMLIVLSIIALLMGMVIFKVSDLTKTAKPQKANADIQTFKEMLAAYELGLKALWAKPTAEPVPARWHAQLDSEVLDPWNHPYQYRYPGKHNPDKYDVFSMGEDGQPDTADDIGNWSQTASSTASQ